MTSKFHNVLNRNPVLSVIILSGLTGFCLGLSNATWQSTVESAQVLAGIVKYPVDNPFYLYHIKLFTIINHISALLLYLIRSEIFISILVSGLLGMFSFQAIGLLIYAINKSVVLSVLSAIVVYLANYVGDGVIYTIWLLGQPATYGILGLSFIVLVLALIAAELYKPAMFCLGLAPCVHPSLGMWLWLIVLIAGICKTDFTKRVVRESYLYFVIGFVIALISFAYQLHLMQDLPSVTTEVKKQYIDSYVKYWGSHQKKLYHDFQTVREDFKSWGVFFCIYSILASIMGLKLFKKESSLLFLFGTLAISGTLALLSGIITHVPQEKIPLYILIFMPGRYVNLNNVILVPCLIGIMTHRDNRSLIGNYNIFIFFLVTSFFSRHAEVQMFSLAVILIWLGYLAYKKNGTGEKTTPLRTRDHRVDYATLLGVFLMIFLVINLQSENYIRHFFVSSCRFQDRTNNQFYKMISERKGLLASTPNFPFIQLRTRRAILLDMASPNTVTYAPESGEAFNHILKRVYGIDILIAPADEHRHREIISEWFKELWEKRTVEEWQTIKKEFGVTDILTEASWKLKLPVVGYENDMALFEIPCE